MIGKCLKEADMDYTTLIVQAEADDDGRSRIELALAVALQFKAMLVGIAARDLVPLIPMMAIPGNPPGSSALLATEEGEIRAGLDTAEQLFRTLAEGTGARISWRSRIAAPASVLAREARTADLVVVGRRPERDSASWSRHADPGDVLMRAGRPILVVPPGLSSLAADHVVIAWKDSLEARRAVTDAMPFLTRAASVLVLQVCDDASEQELAAEIVRDVATYLTGHGVAATGEARLLREATVSAELLLAAEQHGAELVVAGGYAHTRLQEWVFGGLTRTLLGHFPKCCLLSH